MGEYVLLIQHTEGPMAAPLKRQNFDVTSEQDAEITWLKEALGAASAKEAVMRAVRITAILSREAREGKVLMVRGADGVSERLIIPELERPADGPWKYLVERSNGQMRVKGRRLPASVVWGGMITNRQTVAEAAEDWDLPVEAVEEAVRWCEANRALIEMDAQEERLNLESNA